MTKDSLKNVVVGFKVDIELYDFLNRLPNKSEFIRRAILEQLGMNCPLCAGAGSVSRGIGEHYQPILQSNAQRICGFCGESEALPLPGHDIPASEQIRWDHFFLGGTFYCQACFEAAAANERKTIKLNR